MEKLKDLKSKIENELKEKYEDIHVDIIEHWQVLTERNYIHEHYGKGYTGQKQSKIIVSWNKFYDRIAGNEWMFGSNAHFKFDRETGKIINLKEDLFIEEVVENFINNMKKEYLV